MDENINKLLWKHSKHTTAQVAPPPRNQIFNRYGHSCYFSRFCADFKKPKLLRDSVAQDNPLFVYFVCITKPDKGRLNQILLAGACIINGAHYEGLAGPGGIP